MTVTGDVVGAAPTLEELAEIANREHALVLEAGSAMLSHAISAGEALIAAQQLVPHRGWSDWVFENFADKSLGTARVYMRVARHRVKVIEAQPASLAAALTVLRGEPDSRVDQDFLDEARQLRDEGKSYAQIAERLGVPKHTTYMRLNPQYAERQRRKQHGRSVAARRALTRQRREAVAREAGGAIAEAYALTRRALEALERAHAEAVEREVKGHLAGAMGRLHASDDEIAKASEMVVALKRHISTAMDRAYAAEDRIVKASRGAQA